MSETPHALELEINKWEESKNIGIVFGWRSVEILEEWWTTMPKFGLVHEGSMISYGEKEGSLGENVYSVVADLKRCHEAAQSIFAQRWLWQDVNSIFGFYHAVKSQSDEIIDRFSKYHPEFEDWRLPAISDEDRENIKEAMRTALANALSGLETWEEWIV